MARLQLIGFAAALALGLVFHAVPAMAQPGAAPVVQPPATSAPTPFKRWGIGLHTSSGEMSSSLNPDNKIKFGGGGLHVSYRVNHRWGFQVSLDATKGEYAPGIDRDSRPMTLAATLHLGNSPTWDWYLLAGFGGSREIVTSMDPNGREIELEYRQVHVHMGGGLEYRWGSIGLGAEFRIVGAARDENYTQGAPAEGPVPEESSGAMLRLVGTYHF